MVYTSLKARAAELSSRSLHRLAGAGSWSEGREERRRQWLDMLGLDPLPERGDLAVEVTGVVERDDFVVEKLHYQMLPDCRITANLYRPREVRAPLPGVVYVCGHSPRGKFHYQPHARWFGRHGYICLIVDTIEIGELVSTHHGTYHKGYWHWYSQGYSPAATEVWAAMRGADYLCQRPEVDPLALGITGISGGGAIAWFTGAADPRFRVVAPVCQTGTMEQQVAERTIDGHCDCTTWVNHLGWDLTDVAALIAPRPLFVGSATEDCIWRPWSNRELLHRVRKLYRALGCEELFEVVEDIVPHSYTPKIRTALFAWFDHHLKGLHGGAVEDLDGDDLDDSVLTVFPGGQPPADDQLVTVHDRLIPLPDPPVIDGAASLAAHRDATVARLRELTFRHLPEPREVPAHSARPRGLSGEVAYSSYRFETEPGLPLQAWLLMPVDGPFPCPVVVGPTQPEARSTFSAQGSGLPGLPAGVGRGTVEVRGTGDTSIGPGLEWTVRRSYPLLGMSLPERRTLDLLRGLDVLREQPGVGRLAVYGTGYQAALAIYAAVLDPRISEIILKDPVDTHWNGGPEFCHVLRVGDLPHNLALVYPRRITFVGAVPEGYQWTKQTYGAAGAGDRFVELADLREWRPAVD